jgi:hypothetical protein
MNDKLDARVYYNAGRYTAEVRGAVIGHYANERDAFNAIADKRFATMKADMDAKGQPTLRDQFAMAALPILPNPQNKAEASLVAEAAYHMADAMLQERAK